MASSDSHGLECSHCFVVITSNQFGTSSSFKTGLSDANRKLDRDLIEAVGFLQLDSSTGDLELGRCCCLSSSLATRSNAGRYWCWFTCVVPCHCWVIVVVSELMRSLDSPSEMQPRQATWSCCCCAIPMRTSRTNWHQIGRSGCVSDRSIDFIVFACSRWPQLRLQISAQCRGLARIGSAEGTGGPRRAGGRRSVCRRESGAHPALGGGRARTAGRAACRHDLVGTTLATNWCAGH